MRTIYDLAPTPCYSHVNYLTVVCPCVFITQTFPCQMSLLNTFPEVSLKTPTAIHQWQPPSPDAQRPVEGRSWYASPCVTPIYSVNVRQRSWRLWANPRCEVRKNSIEFPSVFVLSYIHVGLGLCTKFLQITCLSRMFYTIYIMWSPNLCYLYPRSCYSPLSY